MIAMELFCCSGGMAAGFREAGIRFDHVFDWSEDACHSYATNLGHGPIQMDVRDLVRMARRGWSPGHLDLIVADPPCVPWSRAGKRRGLDDERDMLRETADLIALLRPRAYLIGNVPGLQDASQRHVVQSVIGGLAQHGYCVADYAQFDAADYGVPQSRVRPFWYGHRDGPCVRWPEPTHCDPAKRAPTLPGMTSLLPWVTCGEALAHLSPEELGKPVRTRWKKYDVTKGEHGPSEPDAPARTLTTNTHCDGALLRHKKHPISEPDKPAFTITARDAGGAQGGKVLACSSHGKQRSHDAVVLSERAVAILQGFPENWHFAGKTKKSRFEQLGMAMPPALAAAVARSVKRALEMTTEARRAG